MTAPLAKGACKCGLVQFGVTGKLLFRAYCHCTICQSFNDADFADILVLRSKDVSVEGRDSIAFKNYRNPPLLKRGRCSVCNGVAVEEMTIPLFPRLTIIPLQTLGQPAELPPPSFHMFYHRRTADADDTIPKYSGYISSQTRFSASLMKALLAGS